MWTDKGFLTLIIFLLTFVAIGCIVTELFAVPLINEVVIAATVAGVVSLFYAKGD